MPARPASPAPRRSTRTGGRVRSSEAADDVMRAAVGLLEEAGYRGVTIEGISQRANVAKSTIYRWWKSKGALVMDAYSQAVDTRMPNPDTGSIADDLQAFLSQLYRVTRQPARAQALRGMMVEAQLDPEFAPEFRRWVESRRSIVAEMITRAIDRH